MIDIAQCGIKPLAWLQWLTLAAKNEIANGVCQSSLLLKFVSCCDT